MKKISKILMGVSVMAMAPAMAHAAGTYYTGAYQSPQQRYSTNTGYNAGYNNAGYNQSGYASQNRGYAQQNGRGTQSRSATSSRSNTYSAPRGTQNTNQNQTQSQNTPRKQNNKSGDMGFFAGGGLFHEFAHWGFEMNTLGSKLDYNNIAWNVLDLNGGYKFMVGNTPMQVTAGFKYGIQYGESNMIDDDITNGGEEILIETTGDDVTSYQKALSVGTSKDGSMLGFNVGLGLTDFFRWGNVRVTPSIGYRYMQTTLETKQNNGIAMWAFGDGFVAQGTDQKEWPPVLIVYDKNANSTPILINYVYDKDQNKLLQEGWADKSVIDYIDLDSIYSVYQPGTSHKYETTWAGPYLALDFDYDINAKNAVNARVELGLPAYTATGDQPYRIDWAHPKSVEDKGGFGDAYHLGLAANWTTALSNTVSLSVGMTFDYYSVSGADSKTYNSSTYYNALYEYIRDTQYGGNEDAMLGKVEGIVGNEQAINIKNAKDTNNWTDSFGGEVESFYKSLGIRVGINARF